ncbi:putative leader peptide [Streptomyces purpurascens]|uniref:putative leader peptide n=1 Tax=Streptomyces purpurascens TaxID=1924 RepID=UPI0033DEE22C
MTISTVGVRAAVEPVASAGDGDWKRRSVRRPLLVCVMDSSGGCGGRWRRLPYAHPGPAVREVDYDRRGRGNPGRSLGIDGESAVTPPMAGGGARRRSSPGDLRSRGQQPGNRPRESCGTCETGTCRGRSGSPVNSRPGPLAWLPIGLPWKGIPIAASSKPSRLRERPSGSMSIMFDRQKLTQRRHVDLSRVSSAVCRSAAA